MTSNQIITGNESMWGNVRLSTSQIALINKSPTLVSQLLDYQAAVAAGSLNPIVQGPDGSMFFKEGGGITFASNWKTWPDGEVIGSLAHEIGHFANVKADTDFKSAYAVPSSSPDAYAMSAMVGLHQEGEAVYNNWVVQREILSNNGPQIYLAGEYKANPDGSVSSTGLQSLLDTQHATDIRSSSLIGSNRQILIDSAMGVYATLPNSVNWQAYFNYYGAASGAQAPAPGTLQSVTFTNNNATNQIGSMSENYSSGNTIQVKFTGTAPSTSTVTNPSGNLLTENVYTSATVNANNATVNLLNGATATVNGTGNTINAGNNVTVTANGTNNTINTGANDLVCTSNNVFNVGANVATWQTLKVWGDTTGTGQFQSGQLYTLDQLGIAGINLDATHISQDSNGNTILDDGTYTRADGTTGDIAGVNLMFNPGNGQTPSAADTFAQKQVNQLIQAMAAYAPDAAGSIVAQALPQDQTTLQLAAH